MATKALALVPEVISEEIKTPVAQEVAAAHNAEFEAKRLAARETYFADIRDLGVNAGRVAVSLFGIAVRFQSEVAAKNLVADDASATYETYAAGLASVSGADAMEAGALKTAISQLKTFAHSGAVALGSDLYTRVRVLRKELRTEDQTGSPYANFCAINRAVQKLVVDAGTVKDLASKVTDAWIISVISKTPAADRDDVAKFKAIVDAAAKLGKGDTFKGNADFQRMVAFMTSLHSQVAVKLPTLELVDKVA